MGRRVDYSVKIREDLGFLIPKAVRTGPVLYSAFKSFPFLLDKAIQFSSDIPASEVDFQASLF